ncbi:hypothetical protein DRP05_00570 [Archaeoglobales archaeon]|nr:MAG: hypothetical protein DRP05_00570 [Archaeoglobales archaeon]
MNISRHDLENIFGRIGENIVKPNIALPANIKIIAVSLLKRKMKCEAILEIVILGRNPSSLRSSPSLRSSHITSGYAVRLAHPNATAKLISRRDITKR